MHFPDQEPEYVHGELRYKPIPDRIHGKLQALLGTLFAAQLGQFGFSAESEVRCKLSSDIYRLPDVAVFGPDHPEDLLPDVPPLVVIEIVSRDEKYTELLEKLEDYRTWGVKNIWVVDPWRWRLSVFDNSGLHDVEALRLSEPRFEVNPDQLFRNLPIPPR